MKLGILTVVALGVLAGAAAAKTERTYYTPDRIAIGQENAKDYDWAKALRKRILETGDTISYYIGPEYTSADKFAAQSDDFIWLLMPTTRIPRVTPEERAAVCPLHGDAVKKISVWCPWRIDPIGHPYQVQCELGGEWYPSNKYAEGDMTSGEFPDDGHGCTCKGQHYYFLSIYAHMCYGSVVIPTLRSLSQAYLLTGDKKYARKGCILLARLATEYPNYGWDGDTSGEKLENRFDRTFLGPFNNQHPHYSWKKGGMITDLIWETFCLEATAYAYDGLYNAMDDPEVLAFVQKKGMPVHSGAELRHYIETYIFRAGMRGLQAGWIHGNEGFHQAAALAVALVMDDYSNVHPNSADMVDYAYNGVGQSAYMLVNSTLRDGGGHESPGYNEIKLDFIRVNRLMEEVRKRHPDQFPADRYPDLFAASKTRELFDWNIDMFAQGIFLPAIGDCAGIGKPSRASVSQYSYLTYQNLYAVERWNDPRYARACTKPDGALFTGELWEHYPKEKIEALLKTPESQIVRKSRLLDGYGAGILETDSKAAPRTLCVNYSNLRGHEQNDELFLSFWARGLDLLPDLGYPRTWDYRNQWDANSFAHNTVTVDETQPNSRPEGGMGRLFASAGGVHVVTASHDPYHGVTLPTPGGVDLYERTTVLVEIDADRAYAVDLFAVAGGQQHDQSWHAMLTTPEAPALDWKVQAQGTLAGPEVAEFAKWKDKWGRQRDDFPSYLTSIRRATLSAPEAWTWKSGLPEGDAVRLHIIPLGGPAEIIMGQGRSPVWTEYKLDYVLVRHEVKPGAPSRFLTVLDGFQKTPVVEKVALRSESPLVLEVSYAGGMDEITLDIPAGPSRTMEPRPIGVRVHSKRGDAWVKDVRIGASQGYAESAVQAVDYPSKAMAIPWSAENEAAFAADRTLRIYNEGHSGLYRILSARRDGDRLWLTLDHSALFAQGPVKSVHDDRLTLSADLIFAIGQPDPKGGWIGPCPFTGTWLGEGAQARKLRGALSTTEKAPHMASSAPWAVIPTGTLMLQKPEPFATMQQNYAGKVVSVWEYGVGDKVETALIR